MKKTPVDTPREGAWYQEVNKPGFIPKRKDHRLRYRVKPDGSWEKILNEETIHN